MAKKKRYRKGGPARLDMRKGGRVRLHGGTHNPEHESGYEIWIPHDPNAPDHYGGPGGDDDDSNNDDDSNTDETEEEKGWRWGILSKQNHVFIWWKC